MGKFKDEGTSAVQKPRHFILADILFASRSLLLIYLFIYLLIFMKVQASSMHIPSRRVFQILLGSTVYTEPCSDEVFELPRERSFKLKYCSDDSYTFRDMLKSREEAATKGSSIDNAKETGDVSAGSNIFTPEVELP